MLNFIKNHIDFKMYGVSWISLIFGLLIIPFVMFLPPKYGYENGLLENTQMIVLFFGLYLSFFAKNNKKLFIFVGLFLLIFMLREVNCGRTLFFPIPGMEGSFYSWKDIKYGYLAHPIYGAYIAFVALYFLKNKLFLTFWHYIKNTKLPIWSILFTLIGIVLSLHAEHSMHNMIFEESAELMFYVSWIGIIWLYTKQSPFCEEIEKIEPKVQGVN